MNYDLKKNLLLYAVTDRRWLKEDQSLADAVRKAVNGGATMIQLREKNMSTDELKEEALKIKDSCNVPLIIDNNIEVCKAVGADGVHVGQDDMPVKEARAILGDDYVIGATAHNVSEAIQAEKDGADYLGVGAAFGSSTKNDAKKIISLEEYKKITQAVSIPVVAIGGINETNIMKLKGLGLSGVAVVSAIFAKDDIEKATREMLNMALSEFE
ncbi:MAG: thiamine phosphate synthase [Lachnospiraceae bacterium]|nr:thiamine phosphate synthase [Lachnospiraceae bacterium]